MGNETAKNAYLDWAKKANPDFVFPNRLFEVFVLNWSIKQTPTDAKALYYLGNYWYANRQYSEAIACWEKSVEINEFFPTVHRNLSLAYYNKLQDSQKSVEAMQKAFDLDPTDARILMELDQLYKNLNYAPQERLNLLENNLDLVEQRDDLYLERIILLNQQGEYHQAKYLIIKRIFHPWEGGEGKVVGQFLISQIELAKIALSEEHFEESMSLLNETDNYPHNLGEGKLYGVQENDINYLKGLVYLSLSEKQKANQYWQAASTGLSEPVQAVFYNDQQPDKIFYQGLALRKLGDSAQADAIFRKLIAFGENHLNDEIKIDYFAVSLPDLMVFDVDLNSRNQIHCYYMIGLGYLGLNQFEQSIKYFEKAKKGNINHQGAILHQKMIEFLEVEMSVVL